MVCTFPCFHNVPLEPFLMIFRSGILHTCWWGRSCEHSASDTSPLPVIQNSLLELNRGDEWVHVSFVPRVRVVSRIIRLAAIDVNLLDRILRKLYNVKKIDPRRHNALYDRGSVCEPRHRFLHCDHDHAGVRPVHHLV
jgi:hypothetical protein